MNFIYILVIAVSILTVLSAIALLFGSSKAEKGRSLWFLAAAIGEAIWGISISLFLTLGLDGRNADFAPLHVKGIYSGAILMDVALLGYISWKYKFGKIITTLFAIGGVALLTIFFYDPSVLYSSITLTGPGSPLVQIDLSQWFYITYALYFCAITPAFCGFLIYQIKKSRNKNTRKGYLIFLIGLLIAGGMSLVFDIILPPIRYDLIWVGPLTIGLVILAFYYAILRFKMITLATGWLRAMSYVVIICSAVVVYLLIFHLVFSALFRVASPSYQVILLNFIMVTIVLCLTPAVAEVNAMIRAFIFTRQIDIAYIVKKLTRLDRRRLNLKDVSGFLAEHMHFEYVGFLVNGKYYVQDEYKIPVDKIAEIPELKKPEKGIWQNLNGLNKHLPEEYEVSRVAIITDTNGEMIGQMVFGRPTSKATLDKRDLTDIEMIVSLMGTMIENGGRKS